MDFEGAWDRRVESVIDPLTGLMVFFISKDDLITAKLASGRTRDIADVEEIREAGMSGGDKASS